jgi:hypothetical protein
MGGWFRGARGGMLSTRVLHDVYIHCVSGQDDTVSQRIEDTLDPGASVPRSSRVRGKRAVMRTVGTIPDPVRYLYMNPVPGPAHSPRPPGPTQATGSGAKSFSATSVTSRQDRAQSTASVA